ATRGGSENGEARGGAAGEGSRGGFEGGAVSICGNTAAAFGIRRSAGADRDAALAGGGNAGRAARVDTGRATGATSLTQGSRRAAQTILLAATLVGGGHFAAAQVVP